MVTRILSPIIQALFWLTVLLMVTGGVDYQTTVAGQNVRIDATSPDLLALLFLLLLTIWHRSGRSLVDLHCMATLATVYDWIIEHNRGFFLAALGTATLGFLALPLIRHYSFQTGMDLALFGQTYWNTLQGNFLVSSIQGDMVLWGEHFNPIVLGLLPFYWLWPSPETLLVLQSLALVMGAIPLCALARHELPEQPIAVFIPVAYLLYLPLRLTNLFDFHPIVFATPLILAAFFSLRKERYGWFLLFCILVGATKETGPIAVGLLGVACFWLSRKRWLGAAIVASSVFWFLVNLMIVMPTFNPSGVATQLDRYGYLGGGFGEILQTLVTRPFHVLSENLSSRELLYPVRIFAPVAFLPLFTPLGLLTLPYLVINLLEHSGVQIWLVHYQAELTAFTFIAAIFGAKRLLEIRSNRTLVALMAAGTLLFFGQSDVYRLREAWPTEETRQIHATLAKLPTDGRVSAQASIAPHLTQRSSLLIFPEVSQADWVVVDYALDRWPVPQDRFNRTVKQMKRTGFRVDFEEGSTRIYRRSQKAARNGKRRSGSGSRGRLPALSSHTTVRTDPYTAVHERH